MSEYLEFEKEYPNIIFSDTSSRRNKNTSLFLLEVQTVLPHNYNIEILKQYKRVYTWNSILYSRYSKYGINTVLINGFPFFDNYNHLDEFISTSEKDGICLICRHRLEEPPSIASNRFSVFNNIKGITKHAYGKVPYCGDHYKGVIGDTTAGTYPSSLDKLRVLNKYKFNLCFENCYHELWSWDYITEKITDCFRAKTIPVYWGCYNIQDHIPKDLYIDYRDFKSDDDLSEYLINFDMDKYDDMVERAYEFEKTFNWGNISNLKKIINFSEAL
jgi:hypothetical protein